MSNSSKKVFAFGGMNFILLAIGMAIVIVGMVLMSGSGSSDTTFDAAIFSARRIKVAPVVSLFGYLFMIYAIVHKPKSRKQDQPSAETNDAEAHEATIEK